MDNDPPPPPQPPNQGGTVWGLIVGAIKLIAFIAFIILFNVACGPLYDDYFGGPLIGA